MLQQDVDDVSGNEATASWSDVSIGFKSDCEYSSEHTSEQNLGHCDVYCSIGVVKRKQRVIDGKGMCMLK